MAARNRSTIGMRHPTVVPTNFEEATDRNDTDRVDTDRTEDRDGA